MFVIKAHAEPYSGKSRNREPTTRRGVNAGTPAPMNTNTRRGGGAGGGARRGR